jgi:hypothetical protein
MIEPDRVAHTRRRLSNHLITRPKPDELGERNIVPSFYDDKTKTEFYVFSTEDLASPGKPLNVRRRTLPARRALPTRRTLPTRLPMGNPPGP